MTKEIHIHYNPDTNPQLGYNTNRPSDPKAELMILCDAITLVSKVLKDQGEQSLEDSLRMVNNRINEGYVNSETINAETIISEEEEETCASQEFSAEIGVLIDKYSGSVTSIEMLGVLCLIKSAITEDVIGETRR